MVSNERNSACNNEVVGAENLITKFHSMNWLKSPAIPHRIISHEEMANGRKGKARGRNRTAQQNRSLSDNDPGSSNTVWNGNKKLGESLFRKANAATTTEAESDEDMKKAMEESRKLYEENNRKIANLTIADDDDIDRKSDDDGFWTKKQSNLPDPEPEESAKPSDTNNNASAKTVIEIHNPPPGRSITARKSSFVGGSVKKIEEATCSRNGIESRGRGRANTSSSETARGGIQKFATIGRGSQISEPHSSMNQQKERFQSTLNSTNSEEPENCNSHRNEFRPQNNHATNRYSQPKEYPYNPRRENNTRYRYVKGQSRVERESEENLSKNDNEIEAIPEKFSSSHERLESRKSNHDVSDKNLHREEQPPQLRILQKSENSEACENALKQSEKLRLQGFRSRLNGPRPDDEDIPSTSKPEVTIATSVVDNLAEKSAPPKSFTPMHNPPPGFVENQPYYHQNEPPSSYIAARQSSQPLYDNLAHYDPLLYRLLLQKQREDYLSSPQRQVFESYKNYQPEEAQEAAVQTPIPEEPSFVYTFPAPSDYVILHSPHDPENPLFVHRSQLGLINQLPGEGYYCPERAMIAENSSPSNIVFVDSRPNIQMANESATLRGTAPSHRTRIPILQTQNLSFQAAQFQEPSYDVPRDGLIPSQCRLLSNHVRGPPGYPATRPAVPANMIPRIVTTPRGLEPGPRPRTNFHGQVSPLMTQYDEASNFGNEHFDYSHGSNRVPGPYRASFNQDTRQQHQTGQRSYSNVEGRREKFQQQTR
ncbi:uncharacterized protein [Venturia canescens]|nr:uncharacterized protein LOC122413743 isoform X2 [Venturia canescens]